ncbi:hypothetical protein BDF22DRAFT_697486 [Syncephalis plumigaleata]|nr:hypothetical protein BDF22DRAFT_697486 [Syncephalis plumigaleata]
MLLQLACQYSLPLQTATSRQLVAQLRVPYAGLATQTAELPQAIQFHTIEKKWKERWAELAANKYHVDKETQSKHPYYALVIDTLARYRRMSGYEVLHPMGWDAFGLPAENAAIERKMRDQLKLLSTDFDWDRELATCNPDYYRWTQYLFLKLYEAGLVYRKEAMVNWDPVDKTVLANDKRSWRSGAKVERRQLRQWFIRITEYAEDLLNDLQLLEGWPDRVKQMQSNWIGRSEGAEFQFKLHGMDDKYTEPIRVFTSRPDTLLGVQFIAIAPEHPLLFTKETADAVLAFANAKESLQRDTTASKEGIDTGLHAIHPLTGETLPITTGAVMGVPAHDHRDAQFAINNRIIRHINEAKVVVQPTEEMATHKETEVYTGEGILTSQCGIYAGMTSKEAATAIVRDAEHKSVGQWKTQYRLRDWLISRQRYWGAPIPMIHCPVCDVVPVPEQDLPVVLPSSTQLYSSGTPLVTDKAWNTTTCPKCHGPAKRDTDTMDTFVDSSWYFLRFPDAHNTERPFDGELVGRQMPVDIYVGGVEHAILHLLYSRMLSGSKLDAMRGEPFQRLLTQGMVHGKTFKCPDTQRFLKPDELDLTNPNKPMIRATGQTPQITFEKMSKSKYNGVDPHSVIDKYGIDCTRLHILHIAPPTDVLEWEEHSIIGMQRWLQRLHRIAGQLAKAESVPQHPLDKQLLTATGRDLYRQVHQTLSEVNTIYETSFIFNNAISHLIKLTNSLSSYLTTMDSTCDTSVQLGRYTMGCIAQMLAPCAPATGEELWLTLHQHQEDVATRSIFDTCWPQVDPLALQADEVMCVVQVNGKLRWRFQLSAHLLGNVEAVEEQARACPESTRYLPSSHDGKGTSPQVRRVIVVRGGHLINFIVK